jgi:hypothetical protein
MIYFFQDKANIKLYHIQAAEKSHTKKANAA